MVFTNLDSNEAAAFHKLLDEYFASRPHILEKLGGSGTDIYKSSATNHHNQQQQSQGQQDNLPPPPPPPPVSSYQAQPTSTPAPPPPPQPAATATRSVTSTNSPSITERKGAPGLTTTKQWGKIDTSSKGAAFGSMLRRNASNSNTDNRISMPSPSSTTSSHTSPSAAAAPPPPPVRKGTGPPPPPPARKQPDLRALYDFTGEQDGDLSFSEGDMIRLVEEVSADWWKGELNGQQGIFPATYVQKV